MGSSSHELSLLLGRFFALLVRTQREAVGTYSVAVDAYGAARRTPGDVLPFLHRQARHYLARAQRDPQRAEAAQWLGRELDRMLARLAELGGCPRSLAADEQVAFSQGFRTQWRVLPPGTRDRRPRAELTMPGLQDVAIVPASTVPIAAMPAAVSPGVPMEPLVLHEAFQAAMGARPAATHRDWH